jgi:hypothetical protein
VRRTWEEMEEGEEEEEFVMNMLKIVLRFYHSKTTL